MVRTYSKRKSNNLKKMKNIIFNVVILFLFSIKVFANETAIYK